MNSSILPERLSSPFSPFIRRVVPLGWLALVLLLAGSVVQDGQYLGLVLVALVAAGGGVFLYMRYSHLTDVWADTHDLVIADGARTVRIPYSAVQDARILHYIGVSELLLDSPSELGRVIRVHPYFHTLIPFYGEHPANTLILTRARAARTLEEHREA